MKLMRYVTTFVIAAQTLCAQGDYRWLLIPDIVPRVKRGLSKLLEPDNGSRVLTFHEAKYAAELSDKVRVELGLLLKTKSELNEARKSVLDLGMNVFFERVKDEKVRERWNGLRTIALKELPLHARRCSALWHGGSERYGIDQLWSPRHDHRHTFREGSEIVAHIAPVRDCEEFLRFKRYAERVSAELKWMSETRQHFAAVWAEVRAAWK